MIATLSPLSRPSLMAKKQPSKRHYASELRTGHPTPAELRRTAETLEALAGRMVELAGAIEEAGLKSVEIDGARKLPNGLKLVEDYSKAVHKGLIDAT